MLKPGHMVFFIKLIRTMRDAIIVLMTVMERQSLDSKKSTPKTIGKKSFELKKQSEDRKVRLVFTPLMVHRPRGFLAKQKEEHEGRKTLILDLDETLVHSQFKPVPCDITLPIEIENQQCNVYVLKRPYVEDFLYQMAQIFEVVIFTASLSKVSRICFINQYADPLCDRIQPPGEHFVRLFREHCTFHQGVFVKDMTKVGRPLKDTIIIDVSQRAIIEFKNSPMSYLFQPENAIPCLSWYNNKQDKELLKLVPILERLSKVHDVRDHISTIVTNNRVDYIKATRFMKQTDPNHPQEQQRAASQNLRKQQIHHSPSIRTEKQTESVDARKPHQLLNAWGANRPESRLQDQEEEKQISLTGSGKRDTQKRMHTGQLETRKDSLPIPVVVQRYLDSSNKPQDQRRIIKSKQIIMTPSHKTEKKFKIPEPNTPQNQDFFNNLITQLPEHKANYEAKSNAFSDPKDSDSSHHNSSSIRNSIGQISGTNTKPKIKQFHDNSHGNFPKGSPSTKKRLGFQESRQSERSFHRSQAHQYAQQQKNNLYMALGLSASHTGSSGALPSGNGSQTHQTLQQTDESRNWTMSRNNSSKIGLYNQGVPAGYTIHGSQAQSAYYSNGRGINSGIRKAMGSSNSEQSLQVSGQGGSVHNSSTRLNGSPSSNQFGRKVLNKLSGVQRNMGVVSSGKVLTQRNRRKLL